MKLKFILILLITSLSTFAQTNKDILFKTDIDEIVEKLEFMYGYDQILREYENYRTFDRSISDSIENLSDSLKQEAISKRQIKSQSLKTLIWKTYINPMDSIHTKELIAITRKYGFPSTKRIKKYYKKKLNNPEFNPATIFIHAPKIYSDELKVLMKSELEAKRIDRCTFGFILWHLNGRHGFKDMLDNGYVMEGRNLKAVDCD